MKPQAAVTEGDRIGRVAMAAVHPSPHPVALYVEDMLRLARVIRALVRAALGVELEPEPVMRGA